ncbi:caspase, EACC1-associated type [Sphaerisporangium aureirubrum]|uniref:EML-like second beta-propeller domain-containing protein n=1 Tax=Sphaerisporangium aureirubrum TaxID=1544736 RepID=A0ABW1NBA4_9ACTN
MPEPRTRPGSRAILIGTRGSKDAAIPSTPGALVTLNAVKEVLTDQALCAWPSHLVTSIEDANDVQSLLLTLRRLTREARDTLLVYFVGTGIILRGGRLCLALACTEADSPDITGLEYERVRREILDSPARLKIVILDCSYSGRVIEALTSSRIVDITDITGTYIMSASDRETVPGPPAEPTTTTPFSDELIAMIRSGVPGGSEHLTLGDLYLQLHESLRRRGLPAPNRRNSDVADRYPFTRNVAYDGGASPLRVDAPGLPAKRIRSGLTERGKWRRMLVGGGLTLATATIASSRIFIASEQPPGTEQGAPGPTQSGWRGRPLAGARGRLYGIAFSPDGKILAAGSADKTVRLWDLAARASSTFALDHPAVVYGTAFSPADGGILATGGDDGTVRLWDLDRRAVAAVLTGHGATIWEVAFSPDGTILASTSSDRTVRLWDVARRRVRAVLHHPMSVFGATFSPDGRILATGSNDTKIRLWDTATHDQLVTLTGHRQAITQLAFKPRDEKILASGSWDATVRLWDTATRKHTATLLGHQKTVSGVAFSPDGKILATGSADTTVRLWDTRSGQTTDILRDAVDVFAVAYRPDGAVLATTNHTFAWLWEMR